MGNLVIQLVLLYKQLHKLIPKLKLISQQRYVNEFKCVVLYEFYRIRELCYISTKIHIVCTHTLPMSFSYIQTNDFDSTSKTLQSYEMH